MGISDRYSAEIRKSLSCFPAWEPGDKVSPGDVGELIKGVFHRQTALQDIFPELQLTIQRDAKPNTTTFQSENAVSMQVKGAGSAAGAGAGESKASVSIVFSRAGAVVFHAANCTRRYVGNLLEVREHIGRNRQAWPKGHVLVSHVEDAERFAVFISNVAGGSVNLTGSLEVLQQFKLADAKASVAGISNVGYQRISSGPILLRLYGFGLLGGVKLLSSGETPPQSVNAEFQEISARDPAHD